MKDVISDKKPEGFLPVFFEQKIFSKKLHNQ